MKKNICLVFTFFLFLYFFHFLPVALAQVYVDYRSDYRTLPVYNKTIQFIASRENNISKIYFKQNLGFSDDPTAYIIPLKGTNPGVEILADSLDPWNDLLDKYYLDINYASQKVDFKSPPKIFSKDNKEEFYKMLREEDFDLSTMYQNQVDSWLNEDLYLLLLVINPVKESRTTWTKPIRITITQEKLLLPLGWLRNETGLLTSQKNKIIYAEDFEGGTGGWKDEYQGQQANSLVVRDNTQASEGTYSLKITNKEGSINAMSTQTIGGLIPNEHYTFSSYFKNGNATSGDASLRVMGDGLVTLSSGVPLYNDQGKNWQRISVTFQARSAFHFFTLMSHGEGGQYVFWDNIQIEKGTQATDFRKDLVGMTLKDKATEDLISSQVRFQCLIFSDQPYKSPNPLINNDVYKANNESLPSSLSGLKPQYLTLLRGIISPNELSHFLEIEEINPKSVTLNTLTLRKEKDKIRSYFKENIIFLIIFGALLLIKYLICLFKKVEQQEQNSIFLLIMYGFSWFTNIISLILLTTFIYMDAFSRYPIKDIFYGYSHVFLLSLFCLSYLIYLPSLWFTLTRGGNLVKRVVEVQLGISIVLLLINLSLLLSALFKQEVPLPASDIINYATSPFINKLVNLPACILVVFEIIILLIVLNKLKKRGVLNQP